MKKFIYSAIYFCLLFCSCAPSAPLSLHWELLRNDVEPGICEAHLTITNTSRDTLTNQGWTLYCNLMSLHPIYTEGDPLQQTEIQASWHSIEPTQTFDPLAPGESRTFTLRYKGSASRENIRPEGFFLVNTKHSTLNPKPITIPCTYAPYTRQEQMKRGIPTWEKTPYADGEYVYQYVEKVTAHTDTPSFILPVFPQPKSVVLAEDSCDISQAYLCQTFALSSDTLLPPEGYTIQITPDTLYVTAKDQAGLFYARQTLNQLPALVPCMTITDYPDLHYRALMLDVVRNYYPADSIYKVIDVMAQYKLNVLHLHLSDDEAWRLEIPGLPQLTDIGSKRGYTTDESECLFPMYCGGWDPNAPTTANGYITREKYISLLRYAHARHIRVIPEIDMPGHMRAAKKAMGNLLTDSLFDTRVYKSAQHYTDNVINVSLPYAVQFIDHVISEIVKMYQEAEHPLYQFNIGGDEVPKGALTKEEHQTFIDSVLTILQRHNLQPVGWEEIDHFCQPESRAICYAWLNSETKPLQLAAAGYQVVIATASHLYFDFAYCNHHEEKGLNWGGYTDEYRSFDWQPAQHENIIGMSAQLWGEVIRSFSQVEWQLYPKIFGLVERSWNNRSSLSLGDYNHLVYDYHLPRLNAAGCNFHLQQPGIKLEDDLLLINKVTKHGELLYSFDNGEWMVYEKPIPVPQNTKIIKAKFRYLQRESNATWLWL
ncbi:MAG: carbohydate-binding domain-containing protein [Paludibacteraceae bacterium]|nr:carbohydate-binding domain-containing protein [Paludibacteraceae bacterium]